MKRQKKVIKLFCTEQNTNYKYKIENLKNKEETKRQNKLLSFKI